MLLKRGTGNEEWGIGLGCLGLGFGSELGLGLGNALRLGLGLGNELRLAD